MSRQKLHLRAPDNWVNDPNGFIYYKGSYHMFYQYFPYGCWWGTMYWGHAVSKDLVNWEHKGVALFPSKRADQSGCFSGTAVEADGRMYLAYTGVNYHQTDPENIHRCLNDDFESAQLMISSEDGYQFDNFRDKQVIIPPVEDKRIGHITHTRDPKIWRGSNAWHIVLGSSQDNIEGKLLFYKSEDLQNWSYVNQAQKSPAYGWMWECPDYFKTEGGEVLLLSAMGILKQDKAQENHGICFLVEFQEDSCEMKIPDDYQYVDYGMDLYAAQTTLDEAGRRVMMAWLRMPKETPDGWIGMFSAPRVVEVRDGHIYFRLHPNIRKACSRKITDVTQASLEGYRACFELAEGEWVNIGGLLIYRENGRICTDRTRVFPSEHTHIHSETPKVKEGGSLEVLVDAYMIEIFINDGEYVITNSVYDLKPQITASVPKEIQLYTV